MGRLGQDGSRGSPRRDHTRLRIEALEARAMLSITAGQIDDFQDGTNQNWGMGMMLPPANTGGGPGGASDLFINILSGTYGGGPRLVAFNTMQWAGDYVFAGVTGISVDLKNLIDSSESIRIAVRSATMGSGTSGYSSTEKFVLPADNAWHRAFFSLDEGSVTGVNSPSPLGEFLTTVADFRILQADAGPAVVGDTGNFKLGIDNVKAIGQPEFSFLQTSISHNEGPAGPNQYVFPVFFASVLGGTVAYATADGTATVANNDYAPISGTLTFAPGVTMQELTVTVNGDSQVEPVETFALNLSNPSVGTITVPQATGFISNDDEGPPVAVRLFYKDSAKWNVTNGATFSDDNAIAPDKTAYLPGGGTSSFTAVSSYDKGINGLMLDFGTTHGTITANDFQFKRGNNNSPNAWVAATAPTAVTTRAGAGQAGSDRIELLWDNNQSVKKQWLEVIVEGNDTLGGFNTNTGLASSFVFYFGNALGDSGVGNSGAFQVTSSDEINARNNPKTFTATRSDVNDFNRDGSVNSSDQIIARNNTTNLGNQLKFLVVGAGGPFAPESSPRGRGGGDSGIASSLVIGSSPGSAPSGSAPPGWLALRVEEISAAVGATISKTTTGQTAVPASDEATSDDDSLADLLSLL
jgi:hypothetical protein